MKRNAGTVEATPSKRLFLSIIADYDLYRGICELVDNAIDVWIRSHRRKIVHIEIELDATQQRITVSDDAGGLKRDDLSFIIGPGQSGSNDQDHTIGIFGVGTKRAIVALAQDIKIRTRYSKEKTYQIEFDDGWLSEQDDWVLPVYQVNDIEEGRTIVELQRLRKILDAESQSRLIDHLSAVYAHFIKQKDISLSVNDIEVTPRFFDDWSYPPKYGPREYVGSIPVGKHDEVQVTVTAGLGSESSPATGEYGVYFYCNDRLIVRALKSPDVGFLKGYAGQPHPKISLTKAIVKLSGHPRYMPWNSSKSDIDTKHEVFVAIREWLMQTIKDYATVSRTWMGDWPRKVFRHADGKVTRVRIKAFPEAGTSYLPPLPRARFTKEEKAAKANKKIAKEKPWTKGIYEGVVASDIIESKAALTHKERIALILLDSTLEISFKEYLVNESGKYYSDKKLSEIFASKHLLFNEMKSYLTLSASEWKRLAYYADLRNKLIHQRATVMVDPDDIDEFRSLLTRILDKLFGLDVAR